MRTRNQIRSAGQLIEDVSQKQLKTQGKAQPIKTSTQSTISSTSSSSSLAKTKTSTTNSNNNSLLAREQDPTSRRQAKQLAVARIIAGSHGATTCINNNSIHKSVPNRNNQTSSDVQPSASVPSTSSPSQPTPQTSLLDLTQNSRMKSRSTESLNREPLPSKNSQQMDKPSATKSMTSNKSPVASEDVIDGPSTSSRTASNNTTESIQKTKNKTFNVLIGVTGSVATIKLAELVKKIDSMFPRKYADKSIGTTGQASVSIRIVMTKNSQHFASKRELIKCLSDEAVEVYDDDDEWLGWKKIGDPVLHIELRKWADVMVIAPLDANTMAKLANGICDNLLTCTVRAWEVAKPLIYCPAMNVHMWEHPITREQLCKLQSFGYLRVDCVEKRLACGDVGMGAMAPVDTIANKVVDCLVKPTAKRLPTLPMFVLNSQPTYPIMTTNSATRAHGLQASPPKSGIVIKKIPNSNFRFAQPAPMQSPTASAGQPSININSGISRLPRPHITIVRKPSDSHVLTPGLITNGDSPQIVKSVNNIAAASGMDCMIKRSNTNPIEEAMIVEDDNNDLEDYEDDDDDDQESFDIDPTRMLEQSMTTGEDLGDIFNHQRATINIPGNDSSAISLNQAMLINSNQTSNGGSGNLNLNNISISSFKSGCGSGSSILASTPKTIDNNNSTMLNTTRFLNNCFDAGRGCYTCKICKNHYKNRKSMARHWKEQHIQGNIYQCRPCDVSYKRREKLIKHYKERHPGVNIG